MKYKITPFIIKKMNTINKKKNTISLFENSLKNTKLNLSKYSSFNNKLTRGITKPIPSASKID